MPQQPKTKREQLHEYMTRPETPEHIKSAWLELDGHIETLTRELQLSRMRPLDRKMLDGF